MATIHIILNGKGGIGKSYIAFILAQYKQHQGQNPLCIDTDLVNATFSEYRALNVQQFDLGAIDNNTGQCNLNHLMGRIPMNHDDVIIDTGPHAFTTMVRYLSHYQALALLAITGHALVLHTIITGGHSLMNTMNSFVQLIRLCPENALFVVWLNPHWGAVETEGTMETIGARSVANRGKCFEDMNAYKENKDRITAIIPIPPLNPATFGYDLTQMLKDRLIFNEAIASDSSTRYIVTRQRLKMIRDHLFEQINNAVVL